jgi:hypothetical protein
MLVQLTLWDSNNATSSQASAAGRMPCDLQAGQTISPPGRVHAPANLSARQAKERGLLTIDTYGLPSSGSLSNADLPTFLANKLAVKMACSGSTLFYLTWKRRSTPQRRLIYALRGQGRRTCVNGFGSWAKPCAQEPGENPISTMERKAQQQASGKKVGGLMKLGTQAKMLGSARPTPTTPSGGQTIPQGTTATGKTPNGSKRQVTLQNVAKMLAHWATPTAKTGAQTAASPTPGQTGGDSTAGQAKALDIGKMPNGYLTSMGNGAALNPNHSRWLMGYPIAWQSCADMAMR